MMFKFLIKFPALVIYLTFLLISVAKTEVINEINITGNERIPDETIKMFSGKKISDNISLNDLDKILKDIYDSNFFLT